MPILKENRRISALRKGIVCLAADKMLTNDRENSESCSNLNRHTLTGTKDKVRSLSVNNPRKIACVETRFVIDHRRFSHSDAFVKHKINFQVKNRGLVLKNNNDVQKEMRPSKLKCKSASSKSANDFNWVPIPYDEKNVGKLIEVYGKSNVGRKSFLHLLQSSENLSCKGQQYATIMCTNSDSLRCFTFEKKDALYETTSSEDEEADACIVMFAVSDKASFQFAKLCVQNIRKNHRENIPIFLVANKSDMIRYRKVSTNEAIRVADIHNCQYFETSLTMKYNLDELFREIIKQVDESVTETQKQCFHGFVNAVRRRLQRAFTR
ncbi:GTP-binding protein GEM [Magallana gigas]|uniref:GTP-binding protein GEM n=1 Tax=Magallana gigas TaxID=29159 RepID=UPI00333F3134